MRPWGTKRLFRFASRTPDEIHADIADEVAFHLEMRVDALRREGMTDGRGAGAGGDANSATASAHDAACAPIDIATERRSRWRRLVDEFVQDMRVGTAPAAAQPRVCRGGHLHAGAQHRRQHGDLQPARCGAPPAGTAARARSPRADLGDAPRRRHQQRLGRCVPRLARTSDAVRRHRADEPGGLEPSRPKASPNG